MKIEIFFCCGRSSAEDFSRIHNVDADCLATALGKLIGSQPGCWFELVSPCYTEANIVGASSSLAHELLAFNCEHAEEFFAAHASSGWLGARII